MYLACLRYFVADCKGKRGWGSSVNRKELVRRHLAETLMDMCDEGALLSTVTVSDIVARADIARQTFYNYFADLDELVFFTAALPMALESNPFTDIEATRRFY